MRECRCTEKQPEEEKFMVALKGLPGEYGIGAGHIADNPRYQKDKDGKQLREWIGNEDAQAYFDLLK